MAKLIPARGGQNVQEADFICSWNDTMNDVSVLNASNPALSGVLKDMGAVTAGDVFKIMNMPPNAVLLGVEVQVEVAGVGPTAYTVELGHTTDGLSGTFANSILGASDLKAAVGTIYVGVRTSAFIFPGLVSASPNDIYMRLIRSVAVATAGKFGVRVQFITRGKVNEAYPA